MTGTYVFPASYAQQRLWFLTQLDPDAPAHHVNAVIDLPDTDHERCTHALWEIVRRHETLRTALTTEDGTLVQVVHAHLPVTLHHTDLTHLPPDQAEHHFHTLARADARTPFTLDEAPLWRARLVRLPGPAPDRQRPVHRLVLIVHHAVFDARSATNFVTELHELHDAHTHGRPPRLPDLPVQYADYADWQRRHLADGVLDRQLTYWRDRLSGLPADTGLPTDRPRPPVRGHDGAEHHLHLPADLVDALDNLARGHGATLFMVLLAALKALIARHARTHDIAVGTPVAGRDLPEVQPLIGMFINTLVLRTDLSGDPAFTDLLARVRTTVLDALDHADLPFDRLVEALQPERDPSRTPLHQIGFNLLPMSGRGQFANGTTQLDLSFDVIRTADGAGVWIAYSTDLYDPATVERLATAYRLILTAVAADPASPLSRLPLLTPEQRDQLLTTWNDTAAPYPDRCLHDLVTDQAARTPDAVAVRTPDGAHLTYADLDTRAHTLARHLRRLGVRPESRVALCLPRTPDLIVALLAVLKAGGCYVPLDAAYPPDRLAYLLADSGTDLLLTTSHLLDRLPAARPPELLIDHLDHAAHPPTTAAEGPLPEVTPAHLAYLIYTSGSTGRPKGVEVPHCGVVNLITDVTRRLGATSALLATSLSFDIAALEIFTPLLSGGTLHLAPDDAARTPKELRRAAEHADLVQLTPSVAGLVHADLPHGIPHLILGGEPLPTDLATRLHELTADLWNFYGPTETTIWSTAWQVPPAPPTMLIGTPLANTTAHIVDDHLQPVPVGVPGELLLGGAGVTRGYHGRPALTAERFVPDPFGPPGARLYRTGDLARRRTDGTIECLGRLDHQVKIRGVRIEPDEIAAVLSEHPAIRHAAVTVRDDAPGGRGLVAYVTTHNAGGGSDAAGEWRAHLRARLPEAMIPAAFVHLDTLPVLPSGKLDRAALPPPAPDTGHGAGHIPPRTPIEETLAAIWADLLGRPRVGATDDFFALGGHSLLAVRLVERVNDELGVDLPLRLIFDATTVEEQALAVLHRQLTDADLLDLLEEDR
ncbi:amino acid adenylation domain-containing protein [Nonomuraea muscovyensis]|uniref:Amino acid adenylation domain-containing protein n=1 Tax=Nonomuraea muscovyensis TaxID=1124761 RepID=A0A7X0EXE9_9ACTN|nr:non-ribosomal peptide synthetase [Nonomuraea muscovyensis]MBB6347538.1 amino acid adenylation domain-containing protein [Nonomuraea muscovyensis]